MLHLSKMSEVIDWKVIDLHSTESAKVSKQETLVSNGSLLEEQFLTSQRNLRK